MNRYRAGLDARNASQAETGKLGAGDKRDAVLPEFQEIGSNEFMLAAMCSREEALAAFKTHYGDTRPVEDVSPATVYVHGRGGQNVWLPVEKSFGQLVNETKHRLWKVEENNRQLQAVNRALQDHVEQLTQEREALREVIMGIERLIHPPSFPIFPDNSKKEPGDEKA